MPYVVIMGDDDIGVRCETINDVYTHLSNQLFGESHRGSGKMSVRVGALILNDRSNLKISFNLKDGLVTLEDSRNQPRLTSFFPKNTFHHYYQPVLELIECLAKRDLIYKIYSLQDKALNKLIDDFGIMKPRAEASVVSPSESLQSLNTVILAIIKCVQPHKSNVEYLVGFFEGKGVREKERTETQKAIHDAFCQMGIHAATIDNITSMGDSDKWYDRVTSGMNAVLKR